MKEFEFLIKNNERITLSLHNVESMGKDFFELQAINQQNEFIGYLNFELQKRYHASELRTIGVDPRYLGSGVGHCMAQIFEQFLEQNGCNKIGGIFYPHGEGAQYAPKFYERHGYQIEDEDVYIGLYKRLNRENSNVPELIEYDQQDWLRSAPWEHYEQTRE